jgi:hypothetical protein
MPTTWVPLAAKAKAPAANLPSAAANSPAAEATFSAYCEPPPVPYCSACAGRRHCLFRRPRQHLRHPPLRQEGLQPTAATVSQASGFHRCRRSVKLRRTVGLARRMALRRAPASPSARRAALRPIHGYHWPRCKGPRRRSVKICDIRYDQLHMLSVSLFSTIKFKVCCLTTFDSIIAVETGDLVHFKGSIIKDFE